MVVRIKSVTINGYKSIKKVEDVQLPQITAIVGPNNSGKSNFIDAIYNVLGKTWVTVNNFSDNDVYQKDPNADFDICVEFDPPLGYHQYVGVDPIPIPKLKYTYTRYQRTEKAGQRRLQKECLELNGSKVTALAKRPQKGQAHQYQVLGTIPQEVLDSIPVIYIGPERPLRNHLPGARYSLLGLLMKGINEDFENPENKLKVVGANGEEEVARLEYFRNCIKGAIDALRTDEFMALENSIKTNALLQLGFDPATDIDKLDIFFNPLTSLEFYKSLEIWINENGFRINAREVGGGFQNAIVISILRAFEERKKQGAIFLIEEPEMYLHPQMQRTLYKTIREIGRTNQVIYTTHSPHFVTIPEYDEILIFGKDDEGTNIRRSSMQVTDELREKFRKELDPERNEMFFAKRVLFVEGDTEKLALPEYAQREGYDLDKVGTSIVEVGGKRSLPNFIELALSFEMDIGFIYDTDSSDISDPDEEKAFNEKLEGYAASGVRVFKFDPKYEGELREFFGDEEYVKLCEKHRGYSKAIKARLIANDTDAAVPDFVKPILGWLGQKQEIVEATEALETPHTFIEKQDDEDLGF